MSKIIVVNNYVEVPTEEKMCRHESPHTILFLGKMDYEPNITAVTYFAKYIFPELKRQYIDLRFIIVGAYPTKKVSKLRMIDGIEIVGYVESTEQYFRDSTIVVAPMLSGAGVQNKIIQAMSYGCCVATTSIGAEGLCLYGDELVIYNTEKEWIIGMSKLLNDRNKRVELGIRARENIKKTVSKEIVYKQFCQLLDNLSF